MRRSIRRIVTLAVAAALLVPLALDRDGFPLSTYPMYSRTRGTEVSFATAVGVDRTGDTATLSLQVIGASDDPLIVAGELRSAIADGRHAERCAEIAARVRSDSTAGLRWVEVVTERRDTIASLTGEPDPVSRQVHARCEVVGD